MIKMKEAETKETIKKISERGFPLYNKTTALGSQSNYPILFAADEYGFIEVFNIEFTPERICKQKVHESSISRIIHIPEIDFMVSCDFDGIINMWNYDHKYKTITVTLTFKVPDTHLTNLIYDPLTKEIVFTTTKHHFGSWQTFTKQYHIVETPMDTVSAVSVISSSTSFVVMVDNSNMVNAYTLPHFKLIDSWLIKEQHKSFAPTQLVVAGNDLFMFGAYLSKWSIRTENSDGRKPHKGVLLGVAVTIDGSTIISIDSGGHISSWEAESGRKKSDCQIKDVSRITIASFDNQRKRIAVSDGSGNVRIIAATSGSLLSMLNASQFGASISGLEFAKVGSNGTFFVSAGTKIFDFDELPGSRMRPKHIFSGHSEPINSLTILKNFYPLSIGEGNEIFLWHTQTSYTPLILPAEPSTAADIPDSTLNFAVGDMNGCIYIMSLKMQTPIKTIDVFGINRQCQISSIIMKGDYLYIGNGLGYIRNCSVEDLTLGKIIRSHEDTVKWMDVSDECESLVSGGYDNDIVTYSISRQIFIGRLGTNKYWDIDNYLTWNPVQQAPDLPYLFNDSSSESCRSVKMESDQKASGAIKMSIESIMNSITQKKEVKEEKQEEKLTIEVPKTQQQSGHIPSLDSPYYASQNFLAGFSTQNEAALFIAEIDERTSDRYKEKSRQSIDLIRRRLEEDARRSSRMKSKNVEIELFNENGVLRKINKKNTKKQSKP